MPTIRPSPRPWAMSDIRALVNGILQRKPQDPGQHGLSRASYAAVQGAATATRLTPLLKLIEPPPEGEPDRIAMLIQLLEGMVAAQQRLERKVDVLLRAAAASASRRPPLRTASGGSTQAGGSKR
jgi:hypothetical protein